MLFSTFLLSFQNESSPRGDLARDFIASKCRARTYLGILKHLESNNADYSILLLLKDIKKDYDKII